MINVFFRQSFPELQLLNNMADFNYVGDWKFCNFLEVFFELG